SRKRRMTRHRLPLPASSGRLVPRPHANRTIQAAAVAMLAGLISTMLGVGGGLVMVPLFALLGIMDVKRAAGTSLAVIVAVIAVGLAAQLVREPGDVHWWVAALLAAGAVAGPFVGKRLHRALPEKPFRLAFCVLMTLAAARMLGLWPEVPALFESAPDLSHPSHALFMLAVGLIAGVVSALFGLGGGVVAVPALAIGFAFFGEQFTAARATSLAMILPTSLVGA